MNIQYGKEQLVFLMCQIDCSWLVIRPFPPIKGCFHQPLKHLFLHCLQLFFHHHFVLALYLIPNFIENETWFLLFWLWVVRFQPSSWLSMIHARLKCLQQYMTLPVIMFTGIMYSKGTGNEILLWQLLRFFWPWAMGKWPQTKCYARNKKVFGAIFSGPSQ